VSGFQFSAPSLSTEQAGQLYEAERHLHNWERWFGLAGTPDGEVHRADRIGTTSTVFQADAGDDTWGNWLQILGSDDTPADSGNTKYDLHRIIVNATERTGAHFVQIAFGASGAAALTAGDYTEFVFSPGTPQKVPGPVDIIDRRKAAGTKAWLRVWVPGQSTGTMDFYIGLHEYLE